MPDLTINANCNTASKRHSSSSPSLSLHLLLVSVVCATMRGISCLQEVFLFLVVIGLHDAMAFQVLHGPPSRPVQLLASSGNSYLESLEQITIDNAARRETDSDVEADDPKKLLAKVKEAGVAGIVSYGIVELGFWATSVPIVLLGHIALTGELPHFKDPEDMARVSAEALAYINVARLAVPLRLAVVLAITPFVQKSILDRFGLQQEAED